MGPHWLRRRVLPQLAVVYTRYLLGGAFVFAGLINIKGPRFTQFNDTAATIWRPMHLFETLYQVGLYW